MDVASSPGGQAGIQHLSVGCLLGSLTAHSGGEVIFIKTCEMGDRDRKFEFEVLMTVHRDKFLK